MHEVKKKKTDCIVDISCNVCNAIKQCLKQFIKWKSGFEVYFSYVWSTYEEGMNYEDDTITNHNSNYDNKKISTDDNKVNDNDKTW